MRTIAFVLLLLSFTSNGLAQKISRKEAISDLEYFNKLLLEVHYNPFLYCSESRYRKESKQLKESLPDSVNTKIFTLQLSSLTAILGDAHTSPTIIQSVFKSDYAKPLFLPIAFVADEKMHLFSNGKLNSDIIPTEAEILSVNHISISKFYKKAIGFIGGEEAYKKAIATRMLSYNLYLSGLKAPFIIDYRFKGQHLKKRIEAGTSLGKLIKDAFPNIAGKPFEFKVMENKLGYIQLNTLEGNYEPYMKFFDSCFSVVKRNGIRAVAIDIRKNTGGNSINAELLLGYFNNSRYNLSGIKNWKISQAYKDLLISNGDTANHYLQQLNNSIWKIGDCMPKEPRYISPDLFFDGKVYLLTGPITFSSANMLADGAKKFKMATLIGEPTGEKTTDFGESYHLILPNSRITVSISTSLDEGVDCKSYSNQTVIPDLLIKTSHLQLIANEDPLLSYLLSLAK